MRYLLILPLIAFSLSLASCVTTKERKPVPPPASNASNIPWNDPSLLPSQGGMMGGALSR